MQELSDEGKQLVMQFQNLQQQLQSTAIQRESLKLRSFEIDKALEEIEASKEKNVYKISGNVMISKAAEEVKKELQEEKEVIGTRMKSLDKNEEKITEKLKELQKKLEEAAK